MREDDPVWVGLPLCAPRGSARRWHGLAGIFLLVLSVRCTGLPAASGALGLGACLWWVAQRQAGAPAAALALLLLAGVPKLLYAGRQVWAAAGLFAVVYTALGVAHALQGPRRKWRPRIVLLTAATAVLAALSPWACACGLPVALAGAWYVMRDRRKALLPFLLVWYVFAAYSMRIPGNRAAAVLGEYGGLVFLFVCALAIWAMRRRSRWFGNSLPLGAAVLLFSLAHARAPGAIVWCMPFALLFLAGTAADMFEGRDKRVWFVVFWSFASVQFIFSFV